MVEDVAARYPFAFFFSFFGCVSGIYHFCFMHCLTENHVFFVAFFLFFFTGLLDFFLS